jgi:hypothetical protein
MDFLSSEIPLSGKVMDKITKAPLKANIKVVGFDWRANETRVSHSKNGQYHLFLPALPTDYKIEFSAEGYKTEMITVKILNTVPTKKDVLLGK